MSPASYTAPAVVVIAYNRPAALTRLLNSLAKAAYLPGEPIPLVISIDRGPQGINPQVAEVAARYPWPHGEKRLVCHDRHLGLVPHFFFAGDLTREYGRVILLEDDLVISPAYYRYAAQALNFYAGDQRVAGISLYALWFNGYTHYPFVPLEDDSDVFFLQIPYTQGQALSAGQWQRFKAWLGSSGPQSRPDPRLHESFQHFAEHEWFPLRTRYLVDSGSYYVFPHQSLATGFGDAGTHFTAASHFFQVPYLLQPKPFRFKPWQDSLAVYDSFFELLPERLNRLAPALREYRYHVDLNGTKSRSNLLAGSPGEWVLTSRRGDPARLSFGKTLWPPEANVIEAVPGDEIRLCKIDDLQWGRLAELKLARNRYQYFNRHRPIGLAPQFQFYLLRLLEKLPF